MTGTIVAPHTVASISTVVWEGVMHRRNRPVLGVILGLASAGSAVTATAQDSARIADLQLIRNEHHIERFMLQRNLLPALEQCVLGEQVEAHSALGATVVCMAKASMILQYRFGLDEAVFRSSEFAHYLEEQGEGEVAFLSRVLPQPVEQFTVELARGLPSTTTLQLRNKIIQRVSVVRRELEFAFSVARDPSVLAGRRLSPVERQEIIRLSDDRLAFVGTVLSRSSSHRCDASQVP
jgi:hypothetical protein